MAGIETKSVPVQRRGTRIQEAWRGTKLVLAGNIRYQHVPTYKLSDLLQAADATGGKITAAVESATKNTKVPEVTVYYKPRHTIGGFVKSDFDNELRYIQEQRSR